MFNQRQQALITAAAVAAIVFMFCLAGGMAFGAAIVWGLLLGGIILQVRRQNIVVAEGHDILSGAVSRAIGSVQSGTARLGAAAVAEGSSETPVSETPVSETPAGSPPQAAPDTASAPPRLDNPREGQPDDLTRIDGIGPSLASTLHGMGYFHIDQIAGWSDREVAWMDANLGTIKGRVSRDEWVVQARRIIEGNQ